MQTFKNMAVQRRHISIPRCHHAGAPPATMNPAPPPPQNHDTHQALLKLGKEGVATAHAAIDSTSA